jgi:hypothetical protein
VNGDLLDPGDGAQKVHREGEHHGTFGEMALDAMFAVRGAFRGRLVKGNEIVVHLSLPPAGIRCGLRSRICLPVSSDESPC